MSFGQRMTVKLQRFRTVKVKSVFKWLHAAGFSINDIFMVSYFSVFLGLKTDYLPRSSPF